MKLALHPNEARMITVQSYLDEFGDGLAPGRLPQARCPICHRPLLLIAARSARIRPRFSHDTHKRARCPLVRNGDSPEEITVAAQPDSLLAERNLNRFLGKWQWHLDLMRHAHCVPSLTIHRFISLIDVATHRNLWAYPDLREECVPFVLLSYAGFMRGERGYRTGGSWVRFWFDASVRDVSDLHVPRPPPPLFFRTHYARPRATPLPAQHHLFHIEEVSLAPGFLDRPVPQVSVTDMEAFWARLARRRS